MTTTDGMGNDTTDANEMSTEMNTDILSTEVLGTNILSTDVLGTDVLSNDILGTDVLSTDVLGNEVLGTDHQTSPAESRSCSPQVSPTLSPANDVRR